MKYDILKRIISNLKISIVAMILCTGCSGNNADNNINDGVNVSHEDNVLKIDGDKDMIDTGKIINPWTAISFNTNVLFRNLFIANQKTGTTDMDLAQSYSISDDGLVYEIILKENAMWSDGEVLDIEDIVYSIETSLFVEHLNTLFLTSFSDIKGAKEFIENPEEVGSISGLNANGNILTITLENPNHLFTDVLSQFAILPQHKLQNEDIANLKDSDFWYNVVSSALYKIGDSVLGEYFELVYNELHTDKVPHIKTIRAYYDYEFEELGYYETSNISEILKYRSVTNVTEHIANNLFYRYFVFNIDKGGVIDPVLSDVRVRKALTYAIDRDALISDIYYNTGNIINTGVVAEYNEPIDVDYPYDPEKSKELLIEAGYDFDRPIELMYYYDDQVSVSFMQEVAKYLEAVGLTVNIVEDGHIFTDEFDSYDMGLKGLTAHSNADWYNEYLSTSQLHFDIFGGEPMFDELIKKLNATINSKQSNEILQELQHLEYELLYKYPLFTLGHHVYINNNVYIPEGVVFGDSKYKYDIKLEDWRIVGETESKMKINILFIIPIVLILMKVTMNANKELKVNKKMSESVYIDTATGIYNRAKCQEIMNTQPLDESSDYDRAVIIFDLNDLKKTNDGLGHRAGDELIYDFAQQIKNATDVFENEIMVARYGGDEFMAFLDGIKEQEVLDYIDEVNNLMSEFNKTEKKGYKLSSAIGYAITTKDTKYFTVKELFDLADADMYQNKIAMKEKKKQEILAQGMEAEEEIDDRL